MCEDLAEVWHTKVITPSSKSGFLPETTNDAVHSSAVTRPRDLWIATLPDFDDGYRYRVLAASWIDKDWS